MTQEEKQLLLIDLSARLPYGVIVRHADCIIDDNYNETGEFHYTKGYLYDICRMDDMTTTIIESEGSDEEGYEHICDLERSLSYLRPMSSMTEEEKKEFINATDGELRYSEVFDVIKPMRESEDYCTSFASYLKSIDWLNAHHFDYRGLIEKGLAIAVTEENNPYKD